MKLPPFPFDGRDIVFIVGFSAAVVGMGLWSIPGALILGGMMLCASVVLAGMK